MKTMICVPCMDMIHTAFFTSYNRMERPGETTLATAQSSLIYDSRNRLAEAALESGADRVLWLDSDMELPPDLMVRLSADLDEGRDYVSGLVFRRNLPTWPVIYDKVEYRIENGTTQLEVSRITDWPEGVFGIAGSGFAAVMMTTKLLRDVTKAVALPFAPMPGLGEDLAFCWRARQLGYTLWCDPAATPGHVGVFSYTKELYRRGGTPNDQDRH